MTSVRDRALALAATLGLVACLLAGQAMADSGRASASRSAQAAVGRAGFAYLTGLRRFAAAELWIHLEPQFDGYYRVLKNAQFMLPNIRLIVLLDPHFVQAYYVAPQILIDSGRVADAIALARDGVVDNPDSGTLHASYSQLLQTRTDDLAAAVREADLAMRPDQRFADSDEQFNAMKMVAGVYKKAGLADREAKALEVVRQLDSDPSRAPGVRDSEQF